MRGTGRDAETRADGVRPTTPKAGARDTDLDEYRALALVWVMLIHCLYWFGLVGQRWDVPKSLLLFEMPVLFFVAGASNGLGRPKPAWSFYASRLTRILIPFWVYAAAALAFEAWKARAGVRPFDVHWVVPTETPKSPVAPIAWHLWFVPVYLSVMGLFPWLRAAFDRLSSWRRAVPLAVLAVGVVAFDDFNVRLEFPRFLVFYSFWAYLGLYYPSWKARPWPRAAVLATSACAYVVLWRLLAHGVYQPDFQWNKFPTNVSFFLLCVGHFGLLTLAAPALRAFARRPAVRPLIAPYQRYGYTIYLFHPIGFALVMTAFERWPALLQWAQAHPATALSLIFPALLVSVPVLAWPFSVAERMSFRRRPAVAAAPGRLDAPHAVDGPPPHVRTSSTAPADR